MFNVYINSMCRHVRTKHFWSLRISSLDISNTSISQIFPQVSRTSRYQYLPVLSNKWRKQILGTEYNCLPPSNKELLQLHTVKRTIDNCYKLLYPTQRSCKGYNVFWPVHQSVLKRNSQTALRNFKKLCVYLGHNV